MAMSAVVEAVDLYRFFHVGDSETLALRGVSLRLDGDEMVALLGPSGSGKSTLLNCLAGLDEPDGGHVDLLGRRLSRRPEALRARLRGSAIGVLLQSRNLLPSLDVAGNIELAMRLAGGGDPARVDRLLSSLGLAGRERVWPAQLSGGEAARAGLAVALCAAPRILLADEPTGEVDADTEHRIFEVLEEQRRAGMAILIATHSEVLAARAGRRLRMRDGRIFHAD